jgi:VanZ family protein
LYFHDVLNARKARYVYLAVLTAIILFVLFFLFHASEDPHYGGGFWTQWVTSHFYISHHHAAIIVNDLRKTLHFIGYGCIGLILWLYFYLWRILNPLVWGLLGVLVIASLDEYFQSLTTFRFGKPEDVLLDFVGAVFITGTIKMLSKKRIG